MTMDRIMALLAYLGFAAFFAIVAIKVGHTDLTIVCAIGLLLAGYDIWRQLFSGKAPPR